MRLLYQFLYASALAIALLFSPFSSSLRHGLVGRRGLLQRLQRATLGWEGCIWFHVASSGEFEQCLPILELIKQRHPSTRLFLSYFSPSAKRALELEEERRARANKIVPWDYADYSPWEVFYFLRRYVGTLQPLSYVSLYREIWPNLLYELKRRNVPCLLFGTNFPSFNWKLKYFYPRFLSLYDFIGTTHDESTHHLCLALDSPFVQTLGDPRTARILSRRTLSAPPPWRNFFENQRIFVAGSLWPEDFANLGQSLESLLEEKWRLLLVPHQPEHAFCSEMLSWLHKRGTAARLWKDWIRSPDISSHLIVNEVGILAELYQVASLVFIGGSFKSKVHNVLEPAAYGVPLFTGPYTQNSVEVSDLEKLGLLTRAQNAEDLSRAIGKRRAQGNFHPPPELRDYFHKATQVPESYANVLETYAFTQN